jgi:predicted enzyme related to lactoylglutathione lyase
MFLSLDYLYVPAGDIEAAVRFYTEQLGGELVWKIHAFDTWVAAVRLTASGPLILLAAHLQGNTPILIYRVAHLESTVAALHACGWKAERGPFEIPNGPCYTFRDPQVFDWPSTKTSGRMSPGTSLAESIGRIEADRLGLRLLPKLST